MWTGLRHLHLTKLGSSTYESRRDRSTTPIITFNRAVRISVTSECNLGRNADVTLCLAESIDGNGRAEIRYPVARVINDPGKVIPRAPHEWDTGSSQSKRSLPVATGCHVNDCSTPLRPAEADLDPCKHAGRILIGCHIGINIVVSGMETLDSAVLDVAKGRVVTRTAAQRIKEILIW